MDGNRRYAKSKNQNTIFGHTAGYDKLLEVCKWTREANIENLIVYAFSSENWNRTKEEVDALMSLLATALRDDKLLADSKDTLRIKIIGDRKKFSPELQKAIDDIENKTKENLPFTLYIALSYGGRDEIIQAVNKIAENITAGTQTLPITESDLEQAMWLDKSPDAIIRTGGDKRLSNFLLWQSAYSELFFIDTFWPAFSKDEFLAIVDEFEQRKRNFGK